MKQKNCSTFFVKVAWIAFLCLVAIISLLLSSFTTRKMTDDVWKILGISRQAGDKKIQKSFMNGYLHYAGVNNIKNIAFNNRAGMAKDLMIYTKEFVSSSLFKNQYEDMRKNARPAEPVLNPLHTLEEIQKNEIAKTEKSIREIEKTMKDMPDMIKSLQPLYTMLKKNLKDYQDPGNKYFMTIAMGEKYDKDYREKSYKERIEQWESTYPVNVDDFIAERLLQMLEATNDIDYNAALIERGGRKKFVSLVYESKNTTWKHGFRAGKEITETARAFAREWLNELQGKK